MGCKNHRMLPIAIATEEIVTEGSEAIVIATEGGGEMMNVLCVTIVHLSGIEEEKGMIKMIDHKADVE